jgi:hypothetical protein
LGVLKGDTFGLGIDKIDGVQITHGAKEKGTGDHGWDGKLIHKLLKSTKKTRMEKWGR